MEKEQSRTEVIRGIRRMAAERFPGQTNSVQAQNALMEQLAAVVPPMRLCVAKAQRDYWPGVEKGQLSLQQAVQLCARDMNNMLRITKMQNLDLSGAGEAQLLDAWGALDYYSAKMDGSAAMQVQALYGKLADTLKEKIAERKAAEQAAAEQARRAEEARIAAEQARRAEEARKAEEARVAAEQARRAEEARMAAEQARKAEEARAAAEPAWEELSFADAANVRAEEQDFTTVVVRDQLKKDEQISDIDWSSFETDRGPWVMEQENKVQGRTGKKRLPLILAAAAVLVVVAVVVILCAGPRGLSLEPYDLDWGMTMEEVTAQLDGVYRTNERKPDFLYVLNGDNEGSLEAFGALPDVVIYEFDLLKEGSDESRLGTVVLKFDESDYSKVLAALEKKYGKLYFEETMWGAENTNIYLYEDGLVYIEYDSAPLQDPKTISEDERSRYTTLCTMIYSNTHNLAELSHDGFARLWMYSTAESDFTIVDNRK